MSFRYGRHAVFIRLGGTKSDLRSVGCAEVYEGSRLVARLHAGGFSPHEANPVTILAQRARDYIDDQATQGDRQS